MSQQPYDAASVLSDLRKLNLVSQEPTYANAIHSHPPPPSSSSSSSSQQPNPAAYPHPAAYGHEPDFEADQLATALEFALSDGQQQHHQHAPPPQAYHPYASPMVQQPPPHGFQGGFPPYGYPPMGYPQPMIMMAREGEVIKHGGLGSDGRFYGTSRMRAFELSRLVEQQHRAVSSDDPLSDDFYFLKMKEKMAKNMYHVQRVTEQRMRPTDLLAEMKELLQSGSGTPMLRSRTNPLSKDHLADLGADDSSIPGQVLAKKMEKVRSEWHEEHKVLGKSVKSNLKRPRELIAQQQGGGRIGGATFQSQTWILRGVLGKIAEKLIDIADVYELMQAKIEAVRSFQEGSVAFSEASRMIEGLQRKQLTLCDDLGQLLCFPSVIDEATGAYNADAEVELIGGWDALFFLIWTPKGRQLVLRSIPCLLKPHQRAILKTFCTNCAYFVCRNPDGQDEDPLEDDEAKLDLLAAQTFGEELRQIRDMAFITQCLNLTYQVFKENPAVLSVFVHIPAGQEVIRALLQQGKILSQDPSVSQEDKAVWSSESDNFYGVMKIAVSNLEKERATSQ